jgi:hypothetical protein
MCMYMKYLMMAQNILGETLCLMYIFSTLNKRFGQKYFIEHCNLPLNMFAITLCDFKCSGMDYLKVTTYLSLSDPVPLQSTVSLNHPCRGITYYTNPTTAVLLASSLPTSLLVQVSECTNIRLCA